MRRWNVDLCCAYDARISAVISAMRTLFAVCIIMHCALDSVDGV